MANTGSNSDADSLTDGERVLHVRFKRGDDERIEETLRAMDRGETPEPYFEVTFYRIEDLNLVTRPTNLQLLRTIASENPSSIRETARLVDRGVRQVHRNLEELEALGMIELVSHGPGKPTEPQVWYDTIEVDLPLTVSNDSKGEANV